MYTMAKAFAKSKVSEVDLYCIVKIYILDLTKTVRGDDTYDDLSIFHKPINQTGVI